MMMMTARKQLLVWAGIVLVLAVILTNCARNKTAVGPADVDSEGGVLPAPGDGAQTNSSSSHLNY